MTPGAPRGLRGRRGNNCLTVILTLHRSFGRSPQKASVSGGGGGGICLAWTAGSVCKVELRSAVVTC